MTPWPARKFGQAGQTSSGPEYRNNYNPESRSKNSVCQRKSNASKLQEAFTSTGQPEEKLNGPSRPLPVHGMGVDMASGPGRPAAAAKPPIGPQLGANRPQNAEFQSEN
ncbi:unnamed protein product [Bursaphelenchus xylophilus]|uniref:(pine wood nematode) hypothetical protein n=1 Tax=Bursaphelenchus xylophilus TaxID=6326 RepID=A0A1I7SA19_BURXY|nr:unnamed protein product [Bursaphelenchus xylophilus]CAG9126044.1 unnamed protein product [Bursaphelenchus xylophilus]